MPEITSPMAPVFNPILLAKWAGGIWLNGIPASIEGVCSDTRAIEKGNLFVALRGERFDGADFMAEAFKLGARGAMSDRDVADAAGPVLRVSDAGEALGRLAACYLGSLPLRVLAVTGSVGKTTVKDMVADVLAAEAPTARTLGNWNNNIGLPLSVLAARPEARFGVFEAGMSMPGELKPLCEMLAPECGIVTRIGPVHLENFPSVESIAREKAVLLRCLPKNGLAILCADDRHFKILKQAAPCRVLSVGLENAADYTAAPGEKPGCPAIFRDRAGRELFRARLPVPGKHNLANALFAAAAGIEYGVEMDSIRSALESFKPAPMRWNVSAARGVTAINDSYNANPLSMRAALEAFAAMNGSAKKWLVLGGMRELGAASEAMHRELGAEAGRGGWSGLITVGPLGRIIAEGALESGMPAAKVFICADHGRAAGTLGRLAKAGDAVLFKGSRMERVEEVLRLWSEQARPDGPNLESKPENIGMRK